MVARIKFIVHTYPDVARAQLAHLLADEEYADINSREQILLHGYTGLNNRSIHEIEESLLSWGYDLDKVQMLYEDLQKRLGDQYKSS